MHAVEKKTTLKTHLGFLCSFNYDGSLKNQQLVIKNKHTSASNMVHPSSTLSSSSFTPFMHTMPNIRCVHDFIYDIINNYVFITYSLQLLSIYNLEYLMG